MSKNHLERFIQDMAELLRNDSDIKIDATLDALDSFRTQLEAFFSKYAGEPPEGTEELYESMRGSIALFHHALDSLESFIDEPDDALLDVAIQGAAEGRELLDHAMYQAQQVTDQSSVWG